MIEVAGGANVFNDVTARFPRPSEEEVLARAPDVILTSYGAMNVGGPDDEARRQSFRSRAGWGQVPAVRDNRIAFLDENQITRAGPRLVEGLEAVAAILEGVRAGAVLEENPAPPPRPAPETSTP
jgi:iron complex transport system substrate-binding protein